MNTKYFTLLLFFMMALACGKSKKTEDKVFDLQGMLSNVAANCIVPAYQDLQVNINALSLATEAFSTTTSSGNLADLRSKFKLAYLSWQKCEVYEFGPAENVLLRANCNIYPVDTLKIESNIDSASMNLDLLNNSNAKGFPAIDYVLFGENKSDADVLALFTAAVDAANRKLYLKTLVSSMQTKINAVVLEWDSYQSTFTGNTDYSVGSSISLLVNAMNKYYEGYLREGKIAIPVGIRSLGIALPKQTEAYYGGFSVELLKASALAFQNLYLGQYGSTNGLGIDDHLIAFDGKAIDDNIKAKLQDAIAASTTLSDPLSQNIISNQAAVETVFSKLQKVVLPFKVDMPSKLGVLISYQDNDGD